MSQVKSPLVNIPFENIIGSPLNAAAKAQALMANTTISFIKEIGFAKSSNLEFGDIRYVEFSYEKPNIDNTEEKYTKEYIKVPLLTIVPIPSLVIEEMTIDFGTKISEISIPNPQIASADEAKASFTYSLFGKNSAYINAALSHSQKNEQTSKYGIDTTVHVKVKATGGKMPMGLNRVLQILTGDTLGNSPETSQNNISQQNPETSQNNISQQNPETSQNNISQQNPETSQNNISQQNPETSQNNISQQNPETSQNNISQQNPETSQNNISQQNPETSQNNISQQNIDTNQNTALESGNLDSSSENTIPSTASAIQASIETETSDIKISESVGQRGVNQRTDLVKIAQRLHDLNFYKPILPSENKSVFKEGDFTKGSCPPELIKAIKVFQAATKPQGTFSRIDGKVDPNYSTIKKLRSHLAPKWVHFQTIIENKRISNKICCITSNSKKNWCASWTAEFLLQLTDDWFAKKADFLLQPVENWFAKKEKSQQDEVWKLKITSLSDQYGGRRLDGNKTIGSTHKSGINVDIRPFTKDGKPGTWESDTYSQKLQEKFFVVLKNSRANIENSLVIKCDYGSRKPCFNDPGISTKLCRKLRNHDDHVHTKIIPATKSWWNILPSQQTTPDYYTPQTTAQTSPPTSNQNEVQSNEDTQNQQKSEDYYKTIQLALTGFGAGVPDGIEGNKTKAAISLFKKEIMTDSNSDIISSIKKFLGENIPTKFRSGINDYKCPCGHEKCKGFGWGQFKKEYWKRNPPYKSEAIHKYEYPGIHIAIFCAVAYINYYAKQLHDCDMIVTSGYRCHIDNKKKRRKSTNHMGKAIDAKISKIPKGKTSKEFYHEFQTSLVESSPNAFQIRWRSANKVSFEPAKRKERNSEEFIATTWIHADVRNYAKEYLADSYFHKGRESVIKYFENNLIV